MTSAKAAAAKTKAVARKQPRASSPKSIAKMQARIAAKRSLAKPEVFAPSKPERSEAAAELNRIEPVAAEKPVSLAAFAAFAPVTQKILADRAEAMATLQDAFVQAARGQALAAFEHVGTLARAGSATEALAAQMRFARECLDLARDNARRISEAGLAAAGVTFNAQSLFRNVVPGRREASSLEPMNAESRG